MSGAFAKPLLPRKSNKYYKLWVCVCSLTYPARKAKCFFIFSCMAVLHPSATLSHKRHDFRKEMLLKIKCAFWFSRRRLSETFVILRKIQRHIIMCEHMLRVQYPISLWEFKETCIFLTDFLKYSNNKFHENPSSESRVVPCGRQDWQTDMTKLTVFFESFRTHLKRYLICNYFNLWLNTVYVS